MFPRCKKNSRTRIILRETLSNGTFSLFDTSKNLLSIPETLFGIRETLFDATNTHLHVRVTSKIHVKHGAILLRLLIDAMRI